LIQAYFNFQITILDAMISLKRSWVAMPCSVFVNSFKHVGITTLAASEVVEAEEDDDDIPLAQLLWRRMGNAGLASDDITLEDFLTVDDPLPTSAHDGDTQASDVVIEEAADEEDDVAEEEEETIPIGVQMSTKEVLQQLLYARQHVAANGVNCDKELNIVIDALDKLMIEKKTQLLITKFTH